MPCCPEPAGSPTCVAALDVAGHPEAPLVTRTTPGPLVVIGGHRRSSSASCCRSALAAMNMPKLRPAVHPRASRSCWSARPSSCSRVPVRRATRGNPAHPVDPFYATRVVVLAKASSSPAPCSPASGSGSCSSWPALGCAGPDAYLRVFSVLGGGSACSPAGSSPSTSAPSRRPTTTTPTRARRPQQPGSVDAVTDDATTKTPAQSPAHLDARPPRPGARRVAPRLAEVRRRST